MRLWPKELIALQTLYSQFSEKFSSETGECSREERLAWASKQVGREITSFKQLTSGEAVQLIRFLKKALGQSTTLPRKRRSREAAMARGTAGRKGNVEAIAIMASPEDLAEVDRMRERIGMTSEQFDSWMRSRKSPNGGRGSALRTIADCNKVRWALKSMLRRVG
jgi:hypothetical protein